MLGAGDARRSYESGDARRSMMLGTGDAQLSYESSDVDAQCLVMLGAQW